MWLTERLIAILAPHTCLGCGSEGSLLCLKCAQELATVPSRCYRCHRITEGFRTCSGCRKQSSLYASQPFTLYTELPKLVVHKLKFERAKAAAPAMAQAMALRIAMNNQFVVTHTPTVPARVRGRGYDQAELIARELARLTGALYVPLLVRAGNGRQVGQGRSARHRQMQDAFRARQLPIIQERQVVLVDDVLTTGATCEAAARVLRQAGAKRVSAVVFAVA